MNARLQRALIVVLLMAAIAIIYLPVRNYGFVIIADSEHPGNSGITSGLSWSTVRWSFTHVVAGNWYPLTMLSHAMDHQFLGPNPGGHHLTNVALHMANTLLLFALLLRMLPQPKGFKSNLWPSAIIAALFGLHPLRVESVAWVAERKDVLSGFFFLLTLLAYVSYIQARAARQQAAVIVQPMESPTTPAGVSLEAANLEITTSPPPEATPPDAQPTQPQPLKWYLLALGIFVLGLLAKPMLVTLPCLLLLLDFWPLNRFSKDATGSLRGLVLEKVPFFLLTVAFSIITYFAQKKDSLVIDFATLPLKTRLANSIVSYGRYIGKTLWPKSLAAYYPFEKWQPSQVILAALLFAGISALAVWMVRRRPYIFVGWFWFAGLLFPVIGITQVAMQSMADRFTYLP
ncbi:MAG: hypothetical protein ACXWIU_12520, partial [Limisphaerales bacterium]